MNAEQVVCHYTYGGETRIHAAQPVKTPYAEKGIKVGSYFQFRPVFQDEPAGHAAIKIYTYVDRDEGPALIHQASFPYPPHTIRQPLRLYWPAFRLRTGARQRIAVLVRDGSGLRSTRRADFLSLALAGLLFTIAPVWSEPVRLIFAGDIMLDDGPGRK